MLYRTNPKNQNQLSILGYGCLRYSKRGTGIDQAKAETRQAMEAEMARPREKQEAELEKIREKYDQAQAKIQELMEKGSRVK